MSAGPPDGAAFVLDWSNRCPDALQADRADVLGAANLGGRPVVPTVGPSPWYRHSVPPQGHDLASYLGALRVRDMLLGRP